MRYFISTQSPAIHKVVHVFLTIYICVFLPENLTREFSGYENSLPGCVLEITPGSETACVSQKCCQRFKATAFAADYQIIKREGTGPDPAPPAPTSATSTSPSSLGTCPSFMCHLETIAFIRISNSKQVKAACTTNSSFWAQMVRLFLQQVLAPS